jgi:hypothetical protein
MIQAALLFRVMRNRMLNRLGFLILNPLTMLSD